MFQMEIRKKSELDKSRKRRAKMKGYSLAELIIALIIVGILSAISLPYIFNYRRVYKSEEQARTLMDLMKETGQLALTRRRTHRFEIDLTNDEILIIDEGNAGAADDTRIKAIPLIPENEIRVDTAPVGVIKPIPPDYNNAVFGNDTIGHRIGGRRVSGNNVWAARFKSNGSVVDAAGNPVSATLFIWSPSDAANGVARSLTEVRAVTVFSGSGAVRYWKYNGEDFSPY